MVGCKECRKAESSAIGVILMVGLTVILIAVVGASVLTFALPENAPYGNIVIREARGNTNNLTGNEIVLAHKGGDELGSENVRIIIRGEGKEALKIGGSITNASIGSIVITYENLEGYSYVASGTRKDHYFLAHDDLGYAKIVRNDTWSPGRTVVLFGADGAHPDNKNKVDKKWELTPGSTVTVTVIDTITNQVISVSSARIKESVQVVGY